ncbi:hypothetical protein SS1G_04576 [Sclerotinia sclerotiorum 1980 UF-70]|uniref:F-box domain-containing protein n=2 Tax=Sclerotinia sclerotiorum (strain ATCC 18683 / 1980 / Ss-1) TaxID=665079 RepID=A7EGY4_SCLS1|nr:hypothetical protein SS1G_04576 [Sclerotinia sclerotiorum 1980 UF-70]APA06800.1 hypothetical protein sscle_02g015700 [Sclerotinia sclerotiorum 1980 UF-70]EDO02100.1 hypothetical protein SS1G_04576 [Sclerotinia sclerotiorum 1980 UF-70]
MENSDKYLHGRLDPGIESTLQLVEGVESPDMSKFFSSQEVPSPKSSQPKRAVFQAIRSSNDTQLNLTHLPVELLRQIASYLSPCDLTKLGKSCKTLFEVAKTDSLWRRLVQENVPGVNLDSPAPCQSFKELYKSHDPHWFLTKNKLWFSDSRNYGQILISKYHPETGSIGLYRLITEKLPPHFFAWKDDISVIVHCFEPRVYLSQYCLRLDVNSYSHRSLSDLGEAERRLKGELPLVRSDDPGSRAFTNFILAKSLVGRNLANAPQEGKWPPPNVPAKSRVDLSAVCDQSSTTTWGRPEDRSQINEQSFRTRFWLEMNGQVRMGEDIQTWSTLDFGLYTPTEDKPFRGIFVGDYSGHGCEYLLLDQRDGFQKNDEPNILERKDETPEVWEAKKRHAKIYKGSLCAIKLTGDPNIPRGQISWIADDISDNGLVRHGEQAWPGARIVKSRGQIANQGYRNSKFIETELIMISHDVLAQHWLPFGHISFFHRVNIDDFIKPGMGETKV